MRLTTWLAIWGAESGRSCWARCARAGLRLEEIHRFPNTPVKADGSLHWDIPRSSRRMRVRIARSGQRAEPHCEHQHRFLGR